MASLKFYFDGRRLKSDGTAPVKMAVSHGRSVRYVSAGVSLAPEMWDSGAQQVTDRHPGYLRLNHWLAGLKLKAEEAMLEVVLSGKEFSLDDLHEAVAGAVCRDKGKAKGARMSSLLVDVFRRFLETKTKAKTVESYEVTLRHVMAFCGDGARRLRMGDVTRSWLMGLDAHMAKSAKSANARAVYMRNLRAVFNFAIDEGVTTNYPFRKFRIKTTETEKRSLPVEQLRRLFAMEVEDWQEQYRDFFKLTFLLIGVNAVDLLGAGHDSVVDGRLVFNRSKTSRLYSIRIEPEAAALLERYRGERRLLGCMDACGNYNNYLRRANKAVKAIGVATRSGRGGKKRVEPAFPGISTYWMRHSWATIAAELDIPKETIAAALGHGGGSVTDIYINFNRRKVDEANRRVIDWVLYGRRSGDGRHERGEGRQETPAAAAAPEPMGETIGTEVGGGTAAEPQAEPAGMVADIPAAPSSAPSSSASAASSSGYEGWSSW